MAIEALGSFKLYRKRDGDRQLNRTLLSQKVSENIFRISALEGGISGGLLSLTAL